MIPLLRKLYGWLIAVGMALGRFRSTRYFKRNDR